MRFTLYAVAMLQAGTMAAQLSEEAVYDLDQALAQTNSENTNLVEALSSVISSLNNQKEGAGAAGAAEKKDDSKGQAKVGCGVGTNIAITTATDQHINIFVPQDPACAVAVKKTEGVKIVESDSDKGGANEAVRKALQAKVKSSLTKATLNDLSDDEPIEKADDKEVKAMEKKIKAAKDKSAELAKKIKKGTSAKTELAQTETIHLTEPEIMALAQIFAEEGDEAAADEIYDQFAQTSSESESSSEADSNSESGSGSESGSESDSGSSGSGSSDSEGDSTADGETDSATDSGADTDAEGCGKAQIGMGEDEIFAQVDAQADPEVKMVPQVHVQVTRIGADGKIYK